MEWEQENNSEGLLNAQKLLPGLGQKNSPQKDNFHMKDKLGRPAPSQTPRCDGGAKKLAVAINQNAIGFQKQRPASAAYGVYKQAPSKGSKPKPLGNNNGRIY